MYVYMYVCIYVCMYVHCQLWRYRGIWNCPPPVFKVVCDIEGVQESREDHQHEGVGGPVAENPHIWFTVGSSTMGFLCIINITNNMNPNNMRVFYHCHLWSILQPEWKKSLRKKKFLCRLDSQMLSYQAKMLFMIKWWRLWLGETCKCFGQGRANKAVTSLSAPEVYHEQM